MRFEDAEDFVAYGFENTLAGGLLARIPLGNRSLLVGRTGDKFHQGNTMAISQGDADLRRCSSFLCQLADLLNKLIRRDFQPSRWSTTVWDR